MCAPTERAMDKSAGKISVLSGSMYTSCFTFHHHKHKTFDIAYKAWNQANEQLKI